MWWGGKATLALAKTTSFATLGSTSSPSLELQQCLGYGRGPRFPQLLFLLHLNLGTTGALYGYVPMAPMPVERAWHGGNGFNCHVWSRGHPCCQSRHFIVALLCLYTTDLYILQYMFMCSYRWWSQVASSKCRCFYVMQWVASWQMAAATAAHSCDRMMAALVP
jgi:hypothetical protein